ncbi:MAG: S8 family serine peptidase [Cyclobacteriaceae bacterium]|nr:S8 family serine peptidase [Cyclobacteriaceae bacterium]
MRSAFIKFVLIAASVAGYHGVKAQDDKRSLLKIDSVYQVDKGNADQRVENYLKNNSRGRVTTFNNGSRIFLVDVSSSGVPIYIQSDNAGVAASLGVDELRNGGALGLNLEGQGIEVGIWDEGKVRADHIEYAGRVTQIDAPSEFNFHASHVLGTMIATGVNANAKGMAPKATAIAFDFFNDVSEMTGRAAPDQSSIILSNHSYGTLSGWSNNSGEWQWFGDASISTTRDWKFGFYNSTSGFYDDIAYSAPYYLIVKSAGNDNSDVGDGSKPPDCDPFDCIPTNGVAKNILTVGAVKKLVGPYTNASDVEITSFSSFGPTDDGRIKPDIVAPGQSVFSTSSNSASAYETLSGTSMSSPAATGTLVLLQELHKNLNAGNLMKSATLKGLAIHTAREAGPNTGPDYMFGWGLLDAENAAKTLIEKDDQNIFIEELSLNNGEVFELTLEPKENTKITATLVWTDPAGQVLTPSLNPTTRMLKNDLDITLVDDGGIKQFPWKLDPANPAMAATKGDNILDNVEKLEFENPEPRNYKLKVSHKNALVNGKQDFSLIVTYSSVIDPRISYYWIGNTGNWDDGTKWSLESGGAPANVVPSAGDKVVFDENSFLLDGETVTLTQNQQCYSIRWFANENTSLDFDGHQLTIGDAVNLLSEHISTSSSGTILFEGNTETDAKINLNNNNLDDLTLKFSGAGSNWLLSGDFEVNEVQLEEGHLSINENQIKINDLNSVGDQPKTLTLVNTSISGINSLAIDISGLLLESENAGIVVPVSSSYNLNLGTNTFNGTIELTGGEINVEGAGVIGNVEGFGILTVNGSHTWSNIDLDESSSLIMEEGTTQVISNAFKLSATSDNRIALSSSGIGLATLEFTDHVKICLDHLDIENISITGEAILNAGMNSTVINSLNWLQDTCDNILFPDFDFEYNCENAAVIFTDKSSGPITARNWDFGDAQSTQNISSSVNPIHLFEGPGQFQVSLAVTDGTSTVFYTRPVDLNPSELSENKIELSNGKLISFLPANKYQWVLDGELLEDTNLRSIGLSTGLGVYSVLTFDGNCNRQSIPFLVTGLKEEENQNSVQVYPNPSNDKLYVKGENVKRLRLVNQLGQDMPSEFVFDQDEWSLDVSNFPEGIYLLLVQSGNKMINRRVLIK